MSTPMVVISLHMLYESIYCQCWSPLSPAASQLSHNTLKSSLEPLDRIILGNLVTSSNRGFRASPSRNPRTWPSHAAVEIHPVDTNRGVIFDSQIDVFRDAEAEVAGVAEVLFAQLVLLDFEASFENFLRFGASHCDVDGDLFVAADTEGADGVTGLAYRIWSGR
jgi:hypothetical protein